MARRRKKTGRTTTTQRSKLSNNVQLDKSLPAIPPPGARGTTYVPENEDVVFSQTSEIPSLSKAINELRDPESRPSTSEQPPLRGKVALAFSRIAADMFAQTPSHYPRQLLEINDNLICLNVQTCLEVKSS